MNQINQPFLTEYSSEAAVQKYSSKTAGQGINYLLKFEYGRIYRDALKNQLKAPIGDGLRILEFGCGAGMNLIHCVDMYQQQGVPIAAAYGTDFSERLIAEANVEAKALPAHLRNRVHFLVARSEQLASRMAGELNISGAEVEKSFHLILGVNTFRYCYRLGKAEDCARDIYKLLKPGGVCVMIDMNRKFPMFRTMLRDMLTRPQEERYLPTLEQYAAPFTAAGLEVLARRNFCWIPHSAGPTLLAVCRSLAPLLDALVPSFAMRSLVIARRPE